MTCDITCVITGHREGYIATASLRSFWAAIDAATAARYSVQALLYLDRPDDTTLSVFKSFQRPDCDLLVVDFADQGRVRNDAVKKAVGKYTAFLDADDLWSKDWLVQAATFLAGYSEDHIAHPAYNYFFEEQATIFCHIDQESPEFQLDVLRFTNYWDALCLCPTAIHREFPYCVRDIANGWAFEDWYWNCETVSAGKIHKVVPNSILFKRRQKQSQTVTASKSKSWILPHAFSSYRSSLYTQDDSIGSVFRTAP